MLGSGSLYRPPLRLHGHASLRALSIVQRIFALGSIGFLLLLLAGCGSTTLFQSSFNSAVNSPPLSNQLTGTVAVSGAPNSVVVVSPPPNATGNWVQIQRIGGAQTANPTLQCNLTQGQQDGTYGFVAVLYIPKGSGLATVEFDTSPQAGPPSQGFLHLDFMQDNTVRIDDDGTQVFGTFPRDQFFTLSVGLTISSSAATAHINLFGTGASGAKDFNVVTNVYPLFLARQYGEVKFYMGSYGGVPASELFDVSNIVVTRKN
jgi:hypothetical protein